MAPSRLTHRRRARSRASTSGTALCNMRVSHSLSAFKRKGGQTRTVMPKVREYPHTAGLLYDMFLALKLSCSSDDMAKPSMTPATMDRLRSCSERSLCAPPIFTSTSSAAFWLCRHASGTALHIRTRTTATSAALCSCSVRFHMPCTRKTWGQQALQALCEQFKDLRSAQPLAVWLSQDPLMLHKQAERRHAQRCARRRSACSGSIKGS